MYYVILIIILMLNGCYHELKLEKTALQKPKLTKKLRKTISSKTPSKQSNFKSNDKDGAPPGAPLKIFQRLTPIYEPLSRYGNPDSYVIDGHTYTIMRTSKGYKMRGLASWYGTKFHRQRTSSGEGYDMYGMTAAHRTLPIPTYLRVKNLSNGREAVVKVNDRGPFHANRILDLSYAAATKLGILPKGTAPVEIEALTVKQVNKSTIAHYYVQAGAFKSEKLAILLRKKLKLLTLNTVFIERYKQQFIIKVGPFANKSMVNAFKKKLDAHGIKKTFSLLQ